MNAEAHFGLVQESPTAYGKLQLGHSFGLYNLIGETVCHGDVMMLRMVQAKREHRRSSELKKNVRHTKFGQFNLFNHY